MNTLDKKYTDLLQDILDNGTQKQTRNGEVLSVFGRQIRHKMSEGFPLLTSKRIHFKSVVSELLWFLGGRTDLRWLLEQGNTIWVGDAYHSYSSYVYNEWESGAINELFADGLIVEDSNISYRKLSQEEFINKIKTDDEFAKKFGELGKIYGHQWRSWGKPDVQLGKQILLGQVDQIANLINDLKTNPDSRRLMVSAWNVGELDQMVLPPCHYGFQVYTRELSVKERMEIYFKHHPDWAMIGEHSFFDKHNIPTRAISLMWNQRSVDTPLGLPFNITSYGLLLEIIAKMVNMVPDELIGNLGDTHIYSNQIDGVKEQLTREPYPLPTLNINTEFWPTESGECGVGPIDAMAVLEGFSDDNFCKSLLEEDLQLSNYQSHPTIKMPLSN